MKLKVLFPFLVLLILIQGCGLFSLHALYHEEDLIYRDEIIGNWVAEDEHVSITKLSNGLYKMSIVDEDTIHFAAGLVDLNGQLFMDLYPFSDCALFESGDCTILENFGRNYLPVHSFVKLDVSGNKFRLTPFDQERLQSLFQQNRIRLSHEKILMEKDDTEPVIVLTASTNDLQKFIARYANDEEAFDEPTTYSRIN